MNSKHAANVLIVVFLIALVVGLRWQWPAPPAAPTLPSTPTVQLPPPLPQQDPSPQADVKDTASFEFDGVLVAGGKTTVSLINLTTGDANWVAVGGKFDGYTVSKYVPDPKGADVVELSTSGSGQTLRVVLKTAVILEAAPVSDPMEQQRIDKAVTNNLRQIQAGAYQYFLENGMSSVALETLVGTNSSQYVKPLQTADGEEYSATIIQDQPITASGISGARTITFGP